jgi:hypothetical protein
LFATNQLTWALTGKSGSGHHAVARRWVFFQAETWVFFNATSTRLQPAYLSIGDDEARQMMRSLVD